MASEFITRVERDKDEPYTVIFRTDDADKYKHIEDECRRMIGHEKPTVDAVPVWKIKNRMKYLLNAEAIKPHDYNFVQNVIIHGTLDEIKEWGADGESRSEEKDG